MKPYIYPSTIETARALILHLVEMLENEPDRIFHIALSGGSTPALMFDLWANEYKEVTPWERMYFYWVDERCVPPKNSDSNYGLMRLLMLNVAPIPYENVFRVMGENEPEQEAIRYSKLVEEHVPQVNNWPRFDIVLLGAGTDGHTSSIFPGQEYLLTSKKTYERSYNPHNGQKRIALTGQPIMNAERVIFLITGKSKADVVYEICSSGDTCPAAYIAHHAENVELFMDDPAATRLGR
ncbi:MAG: 6-phosphogluconolactonase [Bacteroides sp.]|nr:6-phosphogluconolactonase [Bacteroides sp.]